MSKSKVKEDEIVGRFIVALLGLGLIFYKVLLAMVTWNLYIAEYVFHVGYWQMFLITFVLGIVFGGSGVWKLEVQEKLKHLLGKDYDLPLDVAYKQVTVAYALNTVLFVILYIIYTLI